MNFKGQTALGRRINCLGAILVKIATQVSWSLLITTIIWFGQQPSAAAQPAAANVNTDSRQNAASPDGQHDFDFEIGRWKAHVSRLPHRLSGSKDWDEYDGTVVTTPFMEGKGNLSEMNVDSATSHDHIQIIAVRLYNPTSRQWSIYGASAKTGIFDPPQIGQFDGNRGEFYATDMYQGRAIYIRYVWQKLSPTATHFEQAFSADGGKTWEVNWIYDGTRMSGK